MIWVIQTKQMFCCGWRGTRTQIWQVKAWGRFYVVHLYESRLVCMCEWRTGVVCVRVGKNPVGVLLEDQRGQRENVGEADGLSAGRRMSGIVCRRRRDPLIKHNTRVSGSQEKHSRNAPVQTTGTSWFYPLAYQDFSLRTGSWPKSGSAGAQTNARPVETQTFYPDVQLQPTSAHWSVWVSRDCFWFDLIWWRFHENIRRCVL